MSGRKAERDRNISYCHTKIFSTNEPRHAEISYNVVCATINGPDQPVHTRSLIRAFASRLNILCPITYWPNSIWSVQA